ncbi:class I adenylate-forming enzyme family protein [Sphingomonas colocasiae]|uniref:AMP-binding protein n=1 Tax=Sphingomonas colocasiae TaxID=1848973 RepID=A0ABS7PKJ2_9SPHN|nr:AMP-binding protein [Sphingomonas colocasiae]MBY8821761.1 AMP-binding protein [Sphingomonas colocasiae]
MTAPNPLLSEWIAPPAAPPPPGQRQSLGAALAAAASRWGDKEAVVYRHQPAIADIAWTYATLDRDAARLAAALIALGYAPGERIAIWGPNHAEWVLLEYAIAKAGLVLVALNPLYKLNELSFALRDSDAAGIFHADLIGGTEAAGIVEAARRDAPGLRHVHRFSSIWSALLPNAPETPPFVDTSPDDLFMIQYTSGTTGVPKAVRLSHDAITTTARNAYRIWGLGEDSRVCPGFPLFHVGGSGNSIPGAMLVGATTLPLHIFKPAVTLDILERERCTAFIGVPTMLIAMLDDPSIAGRSLDALKTIIVGGAPVTRDLLTRCQDVFGADIINCYGQTETCGVTTTTVPADSADKKTRTSGTPLIGVSVAIRDAQGRSVPIGEVGELHYSGPGGMMGYGSRPDDTDDQHGDAWIASGDLARMDGDGFVAIVGRRKEMIIRGGENLSPLEIETYMKDHHAIRDVAVIGVPDARYGEVACAMVWLRDGIEANGDGIRSWCAERISRWKVPEHVVFVDAFPLTPSGKIQKFILRQMACERLGLVDERIP